MSICWSFAPVERLRELAPAWDRLNAQAGALPFLETRFLVPLLRHFGSGNEIMALGAREGATVGAALLRRDGLGRLATVQPSQLPLGPWLAAPGEDASALARTLLGAAPGLALGLGVTQLDPRFAPRPAAAPSIATLDYIQTAWVDVDRPFDAYWEARGKNLRTNMRKQRSKLQADGVALRFDELRGSADVDAALAEYGRLEVAGWKAGMGTAVHPDNAQGRFYAEMLKSFCDAGRGRIWQLRFGDRVVATDLCIEAGDTLVVLKTAFDPEHRSASPAFLLHQDAFRHVFEEGRVRRIEFYGRLMEWHTRWTECARTLYHLNLYRWAWLPLARDRLRRLRPRAAAPAPLAAE